MAESQREASLRHRNKDQGSFRNLIEGGFDSEIGAPPRRVGRAVFFDEQSSVSWQGIGGNTSSSSLSPLSNEFDSSNPAFKRKIENDLLLATRNSG